MPATERIYVPVTREERVELRAQARAMGCSMSEYLRRAAAAYEPAADRAEADLDELIGALCTTDQALDRLESVIAQQQGAIDKLMARVSHLEGRLRSVLTVY